MKLFDIYSYIMCICLFLWFPSFMLAGLIYNIEISFIPIFAIVMIWVVWMLYELSKEPRKKEQAQKEGE